MRGARSNAPRLGENRPERRGAAAPGRRLLRGALSIPVPMTGPRYTLPELVLYALRLGSLGFGGPVALVGYMHRDLEEKRKWISEEDYREGLALAQLAPGPLAAQLAIYLGYVHYRIFGATLAGIAFVLPSFLMVVGIGMAYKGFGG